MKEKTQRGNEMENIFNIKQENNKQAIAGQDVHVHDFNLTEIGSKIEKSGDLSQLAEELSKLRQAMKKEATAKEHDIAVSEIARAEEAAQNKDTTKVAEYLKSAGKWALDVATKIGVPLAIGALKLSMGIK